jgi:hypothetical protein
LRIVEGYVFYPSTVASQRDALTGETTAAPAGERLVSGPRFPIGLRGATTAYVASANTNAAMRRVPPCRHILSPPWEGPYVVVKVLKPGTYKLANEDGEELTNAWNIQQLRRFYP